MGESRTALGDSHSSVSYSSNATEALLIFNAILLIFHFIRNRVDAAKGRQT